MLSPDWDHATDDVLMAHRPHGSDGIAHKPVAPGSLMSACSSASSEGDYAHFGLWYARRENVSPCRLCFPNGWNS